MKTPLTRIAVAAVTLFAGAGCAPSAAPRGPASSDAQRTGGVAHARSRAEPVPRAAAAGAAPRGSSGPSAALPRGWAPGRPTEHEAPARGPSSMGALLDALARKGAVRESLAASTLPVVEEPPSPGDAPAGSLGPAGEPATDLFVAPGCSRVSVRGHRYGTIRLDWVSLPIFPQSGGGVLTWHVRPDIRVWKPAEWETLETDDTGRVAYEGTSAWFNIQTCKALRTQRTTVLPRPFADGLGYAFRTRCPACAPGKQETLHLLLPAGQGALEHERIPIGPGTSASVLKTVTSFAIERFRVSGARPSRTKDTIIGVDVQRGVSDAEPLITVFVGDEPP
jgi:hypothetical protein